MTNVLVKVAYDGTCFFGYQLQQGLRTVQGALQHALIRLHGKKVEFHAAGRTDTRVHALGQYINIQTDMLLKDRFHYALNAYLPPDVRAMSSREVSPSFHARYSAVKRCYQYRCYVGTEMPPQYRNFSYLLPFMGDLERMNQDASALLGLHDFRYFATAPLQRMDTSRTIFHAAFVSEPPFLLFTISANGFLRRMVRCIVGTLLHRERLRSKKKYNIPSMKQLLQKPQHNLIGPTIEPQALSLMEVEFDE